jgi:hypothetical protein
MKRTMLLAVVLTALLTNLALTVTNRYITGEADAAAAIHVVLEAKGGGDALNSTQETVEQMLNLLQDLDRNTRQLTLLATNSAPGQAAATKHELQTLGQILVELQHKRQAGR